jgi:sigma-B regulation protein RsbU (phosphoserine phosphatase)
LVADDVRSARVLLKGLLTRWGFQVILAENGAQALKLMLGQDAPQIAILDWNMPVMTGIEVCRQVRSKGLSDVHIILLSGSSDEKEVKEGLAAGANEYVVKPFNTEDLHVKLVLAKHRQRG